MWNDHHQKVDRPILTKKQCMVKNIQRVIPNLDVYEALSKWVFHALGIQRWNDLLSTLKHPLFEPTENQTNMSQETYDSPPEHAQIFPSLNNPPIPPPCKSDVPQSPHPQTPPTPPNRPLPPRRTPPHPSPHRHNGGKNENSFGSQIIDSLQVLDLEPGVTRREVNVRYIFLAE